SNHIYHQYTIQVADDKRNDLQQFLKVNGVHCVVYYPVPAHKQNAYASYYTGNDLSTSEELSKSVLSLPVYPELTFEDQDYIINKVIEYYNGK
ncbi:MAG: transcriptional regulator, partial [Bacteroidia bacterium]|nr:transcriptional regulator [Bacteroidia bacterium]